MKVKVNIRLKEGVLDPQGKAVLHALNSLGFDEVKDVRIGKQIILDIDSNDESAVRKRVELMSEELLANTVIEDYEIEEEEII
jgi:phosphoribosylformylglycinamidine synthase